MNRWFFPSWGGDFRFEADGDDKSILTVISPTPGEIERLGAFLKRARSKGWVDQHVGFVPNGEVKIHVDAPLQKAGRYLLDQKPKGVLTCVRSTNGRVKAEVEEPEKLIESADAEEAVSTRRPTLCCPHPQPGPEQRASEVLHAFCTPEQWTEWQKTGMLHCYGNLSGKKYEIVHRHHPLAVKRRKIVWDLQGQHVMHCYDWSVPPPEEALVMKLTLEHREHWIRNLSGMWDCSGDAPVYNNPFVTDQLSDGLDDAALVRNVGAGILGGLVGFVGAAK